MVVLAVAVARSKCRFQYTPALEPGSSSPGRTAATTRRPAPRADLHGFHFPRTLMLLAVAAMAALSWVVFALHRAVAAFALLAFLGTLAIAAEPRFPA